MRIIAKKLSSIVQVTKEIERTPLVSLSKFLSLGKEAREDGGQF